MEIDVEPLPAGSDHSNALYPSGGKITDLKEIRELLYCMQRPGITPNVCNSSFQIF